jgi:hypothetical protein
VDPPVPDNHSPVMERGTIFKNADQQLPADQAIERDAVEQVVIEPFLPLKNNDGTGPLGRQGKSGTRQIHQVEAVLTGLTAKQVAQQAEAVECLTDLALKKNDDQDEQDRAEFLEDPTGHEQAGILGHHVQQPQEAKPHHHLQGPGVLEPGIELIDQKGHDDDIGDVLQADVREHA